MDQEPLNASHREEDNCQKQQLGERGSNETQSVYIEQPDVYDWSDDDTDDAELEDDDDNSEGLDYDYDDDGDDWNSREDGHGIEDQNDDQRGLIGLQNLGNTCYMNGALQALSNCQQLTRFVLDCPGFLREKGLCHSYSELIKDIWNPRRSQYAVPSSIIRNIKCIYPAFRGCTQQDTQEFLRCFLEQLHDELKEQPIKKNDQSSSSPSTVTSTPEVNPDDGDKHIRPSNNPSLSHSNSNKNFDRSIITDTFEFKISSSVVCSSCNNISTIVENFKDLSIPIPSRDHPYYQTRDVNRNLQNPEAQQVSAGKKKAYHANSQTNHSASDIRSPTLQSQTNNNNNGNDDSDDNSESESENCKELQKPSYFEFSQLSRLIKEWLSYWFWGPRVTLHDCLSIFFDELGDKLEGDNEYFCDTCSTRCKGVKYLKILDLPEILCLHLKRYESISSSKITTHVEIPLTDLDLRPFLSENSRPQRSTTYSLIGCINHHGSLSNGHYTTFALNCYDDQWYEFDDTEVRPISSDQVTSGGGSSGYILMYQRSSPLPDMHRKKAQRLWQDGLHKNSTKKYFISKKWVSKFNTFVEPGPISNSDFLCEHRKVPRSKRQSVDQLCHQIDSSTWKYLKKLHGGGPGCRNLVCCDMCE